MNQRDPFELRRKAAVSILRSGFLKPAEFDSPSPNINVASKESDNNPVDLISNAPVKDGMSFTVPNNAPDFSNPQRRWEDNRWGSSGVGHARHTARSTASGHRIGGFFEKKELPMYKDKPYSYAASNRHHRPWRRKRIIAGGLLLLLGLFYWLGWLRKEFDWYILGGRQRIDWNARREKVKEAFISSWDAYDQYAWGRSSSPLRYGLSPLTRTL